MIPTWRRLDAIDYLHRQSVHIFLFPHPLVYRHLAQIALPPPKNHTFCSGGIAAAAQTLDPVQAAGPVRVVGRGRRGGRAGEPRRRRRGAHGRAEPLRSPHLCRDHGRGAHAPALRSLRLKGSGFSLGFVLGTRSPRPPLARQLSRQQQSPICPCYPLTLLPHPTCAVSKTDGEVPKCNRRLVMQRGRLARRGRLAYLCRQCHGSRMSLLLVPRLLSATSLRAFRSALPPALYCVTRRARQSGRHSGTWGGPRQGSEITTPMPSSSSGPQCEYAHISLVRVKGNRIIYLTSPLLQEMAALSRCVRVLAQVGASSDKVPCRVACKLRSPTLTPMHHDTPLISHRTREWA